LSDDKADFSFMAAMSAFMVVISLERDFNMTTTSVMVGSLMAAGCGACAVEDCGDGGGLGWWVAVAEELVEWVPGGRGPTRP
jgi:hypothetical protein